ncbi:MAG: metalloregulator ArsR/SmtB family transcription factor [Bacteroidota bacterium]
MRRDVFQAIADPVRRDIIDMLAKESLTVNAIADQFDISRPAVSKHIKILKECGLLKTVPRGRERVCVIIPEELSMVSDWVNQHKRLWVQKLDSLEAYLQQVQSQQSENDESLS